MDEYGTENPQTFLQHMTQKFLSSKDNLPNIILTLCFLSKYLLLDELLSADSLISSSESVYNSGSLKFPCALHKRKILHPLLSSTTMLSMANNNPNNRNADKFITRRVLSAKEHRVKQLQNQLADAHFHLSELSNENRLLRTLQKRQDSALQRYENANGDIPKMINSHTEELRSWQVRYKQLKLQFREVTQRLKDKDFELTQLSDEHKHLLSLSKDNNLIEREKLQNQVADLNSKIQKQNDTISSLQRRISLEAKNHKHQLNAEMLKHRETQQQLSEAINHSDQLSSVIEMKEKMISANMPKKIFPKINVGSSTSKASLSMFNLDSRSKHNMLPIQLSAKGNSSSDSQASMESSKSSRSSKSLFSVVGKSVKNQEPLESNCGTKNTNNQVNTKQYYSKAENDLSDRPNALDNASSGYDIVQAIKNGMPNMKIFESDTEAPRSSDDEVRERVEDMKNQMRKQSYDSVMSFERHEKSITYREEKKLSVGNISSTSEDSLPEVDSFNPETQRLNVNLAPRGSIIDLFHSKNETNSQSDNNSEKELNLDLYNQTLGEIDAKEGSLHKVNEISSVDASTADIFNEVRAEDSIGDGAAGNVSTGGYSAHKLTPELNNNSLTTRKVSTELNSEKKKKLLAALKAIDRGEDDGIHFDGSKQSKPRNKSLYMNSGKNALN